MTGYDFDQTIYAGNCFADFYFYCLLRRPYIALLLPYQAIIGLLYLVRAIDRRRCKQLFHIYLGWLWKRESLITQFWQGHIKKIKAWYLAQKRDDDVIVSATPKFFLQPACNQLGLRYLIATEMNPCNGVIRGDNCCGVNKVKMFQQTFGANTKLAAFYSDSRSDIPMMQLAERGYLVFGNRIVEYQKWKLVFLDE